MNTRPVFPSSLLTGLAVLLLACPGSARPALQERPPVLPEADLPKEVVSTPVPEPRSLVFVGIGGLVILVFALRRK